MRGLSLDTSFENVIKQLQKIDSNNNPVRCIADAFDDCLELLGDVTDIDILGCEYNIYGLSRHFTPLSVIEFLKIWSIALNYPIIFSLFPLNLAHNQVSFQLLIILMDMMENSFPDAYETQLQETIEIAVNWCYFSD